MQRNIPGLKLQKKLLRSTMGNKKIFGKVLGYFFGWRIILFIAGFIATILIKNFGNRFPYVDRVLTPTNLPSWIWGFGNFDGVHYLRIAQNGYDAQYSQAFFPLYPILVKILNFFPKENLDTNLYTDPSYFYTGLILSSLFFIAALYFLIRLWKEEYGFQKAWISVLILLSLPTAFYFGSIYPESLFLLLAVLTFWFVKKDKYIFAGIAAALASATKIQGAILFVFLAVELWKKYKENILKLPKSFWKNFAGLIISPLGLIGYMVYLYKTFGNPIYFLTAQPAFGAERSSLPFVTLPQVMYRYIKMLFSLDPASLSFANTFIEFATVAILAVGFIYSFRKIKFSYWIFVLISVILPTMTGTFSSMPRYALLAFPLLPAFAGWDKRGKCIIIVGVILEIILVGIFTRGYWVA